MADENTNHPITVHPPEFSTKVSVDAGGAVGVASNMGESLKLNTSDEAVEADIEKTIKEDVDDGDTPEATDADPKDGEGDAEPAADADGGEPLPDFDPASEEVRAAYDAKYLHEVDGKVKLNLDAFNDEANAHMAEGKLDINKGSREYIKDTFGVDDVAIDLYLSGLKAEHDKKVTALYETAGGEAAYDAMLEWAKADGGYTADQKAKFNEAVKKGGEEAETAIALLKSRFERAGGKTPTAAPSTTPKIGLRGRRPGQPKREAAANSTPKAVEGFKDAEEHRKAMLEAGSDPAKVATVRSRLRASSWFGK